MNSTTGSFSIMSLMRSPSSLIVVPLVLIRSSWMVPSCSGSASASLTRPVLVEQREPVEARARHGHLEMVAAAGAVLDAQLRRVGKRVAQQGLQALGHHVLMLATPPVPGPAYPVRDGGDRPVSARHRLLPTERVPLHIFEPRTGS